MSCCGGAETSRAADSSHAPWEVVPISTYQIQSQRDVRFQPLSNRPSSTFCVVIYISRFSSSNTHASTWYPIPKGLSRCLEAPVAKKKLTVGCFRISNRSRMSMDARSSIRICELSDGVRSTRVFHESRGRVRLRLVSFLDVLLESVVPNTSSHAWCR